MFALALLLLTLPAVIQGFLISSSVRLAVVRPPSALSPTRMAAVPQQAATGERIGIIICDHGSRRAAANDMLLEVASRFTGHSTASSASSAAIVQIAHMELAEPTIEQAFDKCVAAGATAVVCHPFFLSPGRHMMTDIPEMLQAAAAKHPNVRWLLSEPLGLAPLMPQLMHDTVAAAVAKGGWHTGAEVDSDS
jgi:sirohydrochlorin ferrochelatase